MHGVVVEESLCIEYCVILKLSETGQPLLQLTVFHESQRQTLYFIQWFLAQLYSNFICIIYLFFFIFTSLKNWTEPDSNLN